MSRSAAGTVAQPGRNVKQKTGLNKSILKSLLKSLLKSRLKSRLDQGRGEFRRQMKYKMILPGGLLVLVPPNWFHHTGSTKPVRLKGTSITCPGCGQISKENRKRQAQFAYVECGFSENADLVGAINILRAGYARDRLPSEP